jgi:ABC-2 type transport system ATP-binding protein
MPDDFAIKVENVGKTFRLPHEKTSSIKSSVVNFYRRKRTYELQKALEDVSFEVKKGDFFGIVGRNGGGKSTLLKLLAGIYTPTKGQIHVRGKLTPFIELGVGFNPELTGRENVYLNGGLLGFTRKEMDAKYEDIVSFAELRRFMDQKLKNYSSGMQVRLAFSIAIRAETDILLLDEVLAVGDVAFQQKCFNYFEDLKSENRTVVFVSHDMGAIRRFCNKAIYIHRGSLTYAGDPNEVADMYVLDNLENTLDGPIKSKKEENSPHEIRAKISKQTEDEIQLDVNYRSSYESDMYVAISILHDGVSIGEVTTPLEMKLRGGGRVKYTFDPALFNGGMYQITLILCKQKNRELLSICSDKPRFMIKGSDITRGSALKLPQTWVED